MAVSPNAAKLAAYSSASAHGGVAAADPHKLIIMLMDGAIERIRAARGCIERGDRVEKAKLIHRTIAIIGELRGSLDLAAGGQIAANLSELYDYMSRRLLAATLENNIPMLDEVGKLLHDIRSAWVEIPQQSRTRSAG